MDFSPRHQRSRLDPDRRRRARKQSRAVLPLRIVRQIQELTAGSRAQAMLSSHSPSILARVKPEQVRHFRLDPKTRACRVRGIRLPPIADEASSSFARLCAPTPSSYFARFVILGRRRLRRGGAPAASPRPLAWTSIGLSWRWFPLGAATSTTCGGCLSIWTFRTRPSGSGLRSCGRGLGAHQDRLRAADGKRRSA